MSNIKDVIIIGAGIGGLVTALELHRIGVSVRLYESVWEIKELGVGINLLPHSVRILTELGLSEQLDREGIRTAELIYYNKFGQLIWREPRGIEAGYRWPQYSIHRGRLQGMLLHAVKQRLGSDAIKTGHHLSHFAIKEDGVEAFFVDRRTKEAIGSDHADIMIGADGIHSTVRRSLYAEEGMPKFGGRILWRGITEAPPYLTGRSMIMAGHVDEKFVAYPISGPNDMGKAMINWIAELTVKEMPQRSDWNRLANLEDFALVFADWQFDWLNVPELIAQAEAVYEFPLVDRDPLPRWSFDRVTLLGDAAHPMYPIGSNGASQAILDANALYQAFREETSVSRILQQYERSRIEKTASIVASNRRLGPESVMQIVHERSPNGFQDLNAVISNQELEDISKQYKQIAGFDNETLESLDIQEVDV
jgi:2-polyprenyl-6-methoxyphenol hydroxylase-like FAD-dependent oxidoreductase